MPVIDDVSRDAGNPKAGGVRVILQNFFLVLIRGQDPQKATRSTLTYLPLPSTRSRLKAALIKPKWVKA